MLMGSMVLTFSVVLGAILLWRLPLIEGENRQELKKQVSEMSNRVELLLGARQARMQFLARLVQDVRSREEANAVLDKGVGSGESFQAFYRVDGQGIVEAVGLRNTMQPRRADLIGSNISNLPLFIAAKQGRHGGAVVWSGHYLSPLTGGVTVGVAYLHTDTQHVLIGEIPREFLLETMHAAAEVDSERIWIVDATGEILADTDDSRVVRELNIRSWPLMQALLRGDAPPSEILEGNTSRIAEVGRSDALGWYFVGSTPRGLDNDRVRVLLAYTFATLCGGLMVGLVVAMYGAQRMAHPIQEIVERVALTTSGQSAHRAWPHGTVTEFNALAADLERMADSLQQRERKLSAIFNASPVPMVVYDMAHGYRIQDVNAAWCRELAYVREHVIGRTAMEVGLWRSAGEREHLMLQRDGGVVSGEAVLVRGDGQPMLFQTYGQEVALDRERLMVWGSLHIGPLRQAEHELRELNAQLEARIASRTHALAESNEELSATVEHLKIAQAELVRTEKMAALGALVAGVAHELNTPLGNGVMAISTLRDATREFRKAMEAGLRRTDLLQFLEQVEQGADISARNLHRAADLVQSFKQVAVDQTSAQRRSFELHEVVHEMVVSLRPTFNRTPYRIEVEVPVSGLRMDSYPGALGQAIGNMIQNAIVHGFDGRDHGTVRVEASRADNGRIVLRISDDGRGIPAHLVDRVFEPFVTTKMGQGGTGLGLHISYNAVTNVLGGTLAVQSQQGQGTCFEMRLPDTAPRGPLATP